MAYLSKSKKHVKQLIVEKLINRSTYPYDTYTMEVEEAAGKAGKTFELNASLLLY